MTKIVIGNKYHTIEGTEMEIVDDAGFQQHLYSIGLYDNQIRDVFENYKRGGCLWGIGEKNGHPTFNAYDEYGRSHLWIKGWHVSKYAIKTDDNYETFIEQQEV